MVTKHIELHTLHAEQRHTLLAIITEQFGLGLKFDEFADKTLGLFEDIPGFETLSQRAANRLVNELWEQYRHG